MISARPLLGAALALGFTAEAWGGAQATCTVSAIGPAFGVYAAAAPMPLNANGSVTVSCTLVAGSNLLVTAVTSLSQGSSGSFAPRKMQAGASTLNYNLYTTAAHSVVWGDGTGGTSTSSVTFPLLTSVNPMQQATTTIYGQVAAAQDVVPGSYVDTITVTVTY